MLFFQMNVLVRMAGAGTSAYVGSYAGIVGKDRLDTVSCPERFSSGGAICILGLISMVLENRIEVFVTFFIYGEKKRKSV